MSDLKQRVEKVQTWLNKRLAEPALSDIIMRERVIDISNAIKDLAEREEELQTRICELEGSGKISITLPTGAHRNTENLSEVGKQVIESCPNAYVNKCGQVIDPCHVWFSEASDPDKWE